MTLSHLSDIAKIENSGIEWGRGAGERTATGLFTYAKPNGPAEREHNKQALLVLETKKLQLIPDQQAIGSGFIPAYKYKSNFLDYYEEFVKTNQREGNKYLQCSLNHFKIFHTKPYILPYWDNGESVYLQDANTILTNSVCYPTNKH